MESIVKLGEVQFEMTGDVKTTDDLKVLLRWGWGAETTNKMAFKPSEELKVGDGLKVTIEKVVIVPDPVEEPVAEVEAGQEAAGESENTAEAGEGVVPAAECECACSCECDEAIEKTAIETPAAETPAEETVLPGDSADETKTV